MSVIGWIFRLLLPFFSGGFPFPSHIAILPPSENCECKKYGVFFITRLEHHFSHKVCFITSQVYSRVIKAIIAKYKKNLITQKTVVDTYV
jgi:hypothetical protein